MSNRHFPTFNGILTMGQHLILTSTHTSRVKMAEKMNQRGLIEIVGKPKQITYGGKHRYLVVYRVTEHGQRVLEDAT